MQIQFLVKQVALFFITDEYFPAGDIQINSAALHLTISLKGSLSFLCEFYGAELEVSSSFCYNCIDKSFSLWYLWSLLHIKASRCSVCL
jgi:hypothetical protein